MKYIARIALCVTALSFASSHMIAHAESPLQSSSCVVDTKVFDALRKFSNSNSQDAIREELEVRRSAIFSILDCLDEEVQRLRTDMEGIHVNDTTMQTVYEHLIISLNDASRYYQTEREYIATAGIQGSKDIARDVREWRMNTFLPQQERIRMFIAWANNKRFMDIASNRLQELRRNVQLLKIIDQTGIQALFEESASHFQTAQGFNAQAGSALINGSNPSSFIKYSLDALAITYQTFIKLSDSINVILPQRNK
ncbi:MAG: hypothetical protein NUV53_00975 [Patescibacteria group bacterium]|nr:hypothetical protein [Patescibacteria group bacterium]